MNIAQQTFGHLPGVGPSISDDLWSLDCRSVEDIINSDPQVLYERLCALHGGHIDRCVLYVFRCAVHVARTGEVGCRWWDFTDDRRGGEVSGLP